ncbi:response regulator receiver, CheY [Scytonema sp. HK-05]|uniref:response regulator n=1 Tax=Scytonema sp. HK-05 TaxID=1137095 RepID=UPI00093755E9|nr:response regulator [Scytonema sp. HK-05]OKH59905.1 two-component system response regulator [Scytonema sp. HK-05]BAY43012.1 response regulator receiver, CheY [Scytonema sp. HK-05]
MALLEKILIVEDSLSQLDLMCHYLRDSVYRIIKATSAQQALKIALQEELDLIITDVVMPEMSGFELCRFLKKNPATQKVPIVICSSKNQKVDRLWGMKQGAVAYVSKPFSREQLLRAIESVAVSM